MKIGKQNIVLFIGAIILGLLISVSIFFKILFVIVLILCSAIVIGIIINDIINKTSQWKTALRFLLFGIFSFLISYLTIEILEYNIRTKTEQIMENIYSYKKEHKIFPPDLSVFKTSSKNYNYIVDSSLTSFELHYRDLYGFPHSFNSKDSSWRFP